MILRTRWPLEKRLSSQLRQQATGVAELGSHLGSPALKGSSQCSPAAYSELENSAVVLRREGARVGARAEAEVPWRSTVFVWIRRLEVLQAPQWRHKSPQTLADKQSGSISPSGSFHQKEKRVLR